MSEKIDTPKYPNGVYPELSPNPDFHNGLENKTDEKPNTQVSPTLNPEDKPYIFDRVANFVKSLQIKGQPLDQYLNEYINQGAITKIEVTNIKQLTDEEIDKLECGDVVVKKTGSQKHNYIVTYKENNVGICLSYFDASVVETQSYDYTAGHWVYNSEDKTELGGSGLPEVANADNGKVLEVLAGAWGIGGKKVNVIDAPASTTLTNEQLSQISEGVFINGNFLGYHNPIIFPLIAKSGSNHSYSVIFGCKDSYPHTTHDFSVIRIDNVYKTVTMLTALISFDTNSLANTDISLLPRGAGKLYLNNKEFPSYPDDNVNTYTLKLVAGVLTWVQDV